MVIVENLRGLEQIDRDIFDLIVVPLPLKGLEASPVRAIAALPVEIRAKPANDRPAPLQHPGRLIGSQMAAMSRPLEAIPAGLSDGESLSHELTSFGPFD